MKPLISVPVIGVIFALVVLIATAAEKPVERQIKPCVAITGADSHVTIPRYHRITSAEVWTHIWQEHKGEKPTEEYDFYEDPLALPMIDFDDYMVIAVFQGEGWNSKGLSVVSISEEDKRIVLRYDNKSYQTVGGGNKVAAYGFFVLPRSAKPVVVEENVQIYGGEPPVWKERPLE